MKNELLKKTKSIKSLIIQLGSLRDGFLVIGAALYGFGYMSWALHAFQYNLGPAPGLDAQYFVAGIPVLCVTIIGWWIGSCIAGFCSKIWPVWFNRFAKRTQYFLFSLLLVCTIVTLTITCFIYDESLFYFTLKSIFLLIFGVLLYMLITTLKLLRTKTSIKFEFFLILNRILIILSALFFAYIYIFSIYARIPQALGGAKPRLAILDLYCDKMTYDTYKELGANLDSCKNSACIQTQPVIVYHETSEDYFVKIFEINGSGKPHLLITLKKKNISSVKWIE